MGTSTFAEYTVMPEIALAKIDPEASLEAACMLACGATTGIAAALWKADVEAGSSVAVFGAGLVGVGPGRAAFGQAFLARGPRFEENYKESYVTSDVTTYDTTYEYPPTAYTENPEEWIELHNQMSVNMDISKEALLSYQKRVEKWRNDLELICVENHAFYNLINTDLSLGEEILPYMREHQVLVDL